MFWRELRELATKYVVNFWVFVGVLIIIGVTLCISLTTLTTRKLDLCRRVIFWDVCIPGDPAGHVVIFDNAATPPGYRGIPGSVKLYYDRNVGLFSVASNERPDQPNPAQQACGSSKWYEESPATVLLNAELVPSSELKSGSNPNPKTISGTDYQYNWSVEKAGCYQVEFTPEAGGAPSVSAQFYEHPHHANLSVTLCLKNSGYDWVNGLVACP